MRIGFSHDRVRALCEDAALLCAALALSYLESLVPLYVLIPLPGAKIGLSNLAVLVAAHRRSFADAAIVSFTRVVLSAVLFGSIASLVFSFCGASCSLLVLILMRRARKTWCSYVGVSVLCASAHNTAQLVCAVFWMHETALLPYLPGLLLLAVCSGTVVGFLMNCIAARFPSADGAEVFVCRDD